MEEHLYGIETIVDLYGCNANTIASEAKLRSYLKKIVKELDMVAYGAPLVERFGFNAEHTAGYSIVQLIETSCITGHFSESQNSAHINIFSCKAYDTKAAFELTKKFFGANDGSMRVMERISYTPSKKRDLQPSPTNN